MTDDNGLRTVFLEYGNVTDWNYDEPPKVSGLLILAVDNSGCASLCRYLANTWVEEDDHDKVVGDDVFAVMWKPVFTIFDRSDLFPDLFPIKIANPYD